MEANELRIGNYIYNNEGSVSKVQLLGKTLIMVDNSKKANEKECKPIPLTEEWLLKFGFSKSSSLTPLYTYGNTMLIWWNEYEAEELINFWEFRFGITQSYKAERQVRLDYVHQLQNLTFALTGKELVCI